MKLTIGLVLAGLTYVAVAADDGTQQALMKAQGLLKQIAQQKNGLEADLAKAHAETASKDQALRALKEDVKTKQQALTEVQSNLNAETQKNTAVDGDVARIKERLAKTEQTLREVVEKYKDQRATLHSTEAAKAELANTLDKTTAELKDAEKKNLTLYKLNQEILGRYAGKSTLDVWLQKEPLTGIKSVEVENILQEYANKNADQLREINVNTVEGMPSAQAQ